MGEQGNCGYKCGQNINLQQSNNSSYFPVTEIIDNFVIYYDYAASQSLFNEAVIALQPFEFQFGQER